MTILRNAMVALVALAGSAAAQDDPMETSGSVLERYGMEVTLGGGVEDFTNDTLRNTTTTGGLWNVRVAFGTRTPIAFEGAYLGSAQAIDALGLDGDAVLIGNGLEAKVRVNMTETDIQPFAFAGLGWRRYSITNSDFNTSAVAESDDVLEIPLGVGVAAKYRGFVFDARGEVRLAAEEDLMPALNAEDPTEDADMHRWAVNANIGYGF